MAINKPPVHISFEKALQRFGLGADVLARAVDQGLVEAIRVNGSLAVSEEDVAKLAARVKADGAVETNLPAYLPLREAAIQFDISEEKLREAVEQGAVRAVRIDGSLAIAREDVRILSVREELWERVRHLDNVPIGINEARKKYDFPAASLYHCIESGYIRVIREAPGKGRGKKRALNEADVAYAHLLRRRLGSRQGRQVFSPEFAPPRSP